MIVDLDEMKDHLRIERGFHEEDGKIAAFSAAAEAQVRNWLGRQIYRYDTDMPGPDRPDYDRHQIVADQAIRGAIMMLGEEMYYERGGSGGSEDAAVPNRSVRAILSGYRVFWGQGDSDEDGQTD